MALPITCPKCKAQNPAGAMFCSACGQPLQQAHAAPNVCPSCGAQLAPEQDFAPLAAPQSSQPLRLIRRSLSSR